MNTLLRLTVCAVATTVAGACLDAEYSGGLVNFGAGLWSLPRLEGEVQKEAERQSDLQERYAALLAAIDSRQQIVANLVAEFMPLAEAARRLRDLSKAAPEVVRKYSRQRFDQATDDVDLCLQVIDYVKAELSFDPDFASYVEARLKRELYYHKT